MTLVSIELSRTSTSVSYHVVLQWLISVVSEFLTHKFKTNLIKCVEVVTYTGLRISTLIWWAIVTLGPRIYSLFSLVRLEAQSKSTFNICRIESTFSMKPCWVVRGSIQESWIDLCRYMATCGLEVGYVYNVCPVVRVIWAVAFISFLSKNIMQWDFLYNRC